MIQPHIISPSPNVYHRPVAGKTVVIHATRSGTSMNPTEFVGTLNYFKRPLAQASSHWVISRDGILARVVADHEQAWHAAEDNDNAWGIELEQGAEQDGFTTQQLDALVRVCRGYMELFGVPPVHSTSSTLPGFIGHQETAQGRRVGKSDPGRLFPWWRFIEALESEPQDTEGDGMLIISKRKIWPAGQREGTDWYKSYLVTGRTFKHIPDAATYDSLRAMGLEDYEPDAIAWAFISDGATFIE